MFVRLMQNLMYYRNNFTEFQEMPNWFHVVVIYLTFPLILLLSSFTPQLLEFMKLPVSEINSSLGKATFILVVYLLGSGLAFIATLGFDASMQCLIGRVLKSRNKPKIALKN